MTPIEGDKEEVKEGTEIKILSPGKLLAILPVLLVQIKAVNNSYKLRSDIRKILYLLHQYNKNNNLFSSL